jgi:hypothetical protein
MDLGNGLGHLTYSTLVHPGDDWAQMWDSLITYVPKVKARIAHNQRFGVSLRLSNESAKTLVSNNAEREKLKKFLGDNNMYLYTVNAFPYGPFKGTRVKEEVYEPDWRSEERTRYTMNVANILADVSPDDISPSIQSAPLGFKPRVTGPDVVESFTDHVLRVCAHMVELEAKTGRVVTLALEPEPYCFLETTDETVEYFTKHIYSGRPRSLPSLHTFRFRKHTLHCAGTWESCSTSVIRLSNSRTFPRACRSSSMPASRSSSCRRRPRSTIRSSRRIRSTGCVAWRTRFI